MPFTFLSHQAPVLPLKLWRPRWFSAAGLVLGSMAPDFEKFIRGDYGSRFGHTLRGQFLYCLPIAAAVYWLLRRAVAPTLQHYAPRLGRYELRDYARALAASRPERPLVFALSTLVGSTTHVLWDGVTHGDPRVVALLPFLAYRPVTLGGFRVSTMAVHQLVASVAGAAFTLWLMRRVGHERAGLAWAGVPHEDRRTERARPGALRYWLLVAVATVLFTAGATALTGVANGGWRTTRSLLETIAFRLPLGGFAALCLAGLATPAPASGPTHHPGGRGPRTRPTLR